jgi:CheY-like chemotaxis protein
MAPKILWIDDIPDQVEELAEQIRDAGYEVTLVDSITEGAALIADTPNQYLAVIVDLLMPGESFLVPGSKGPEMLETKYGLNTGIVFGRWLIRHWPDLKVIGVSVKEDRDDQQIEWFKKSGAGYFDKYSLYTSSRALLLLLNRLAAEAKPSRPTLQTFIVHGRAETAKNDLSKLLQTRLRLPEPTILHEQPGHGMPSPESSPKTADVCRLVFALFTRADFPPAPSAWPEEQTKQLLQIFFETGFWASQCQETKGRLIILHEGLTAIPTELPGVVLIDISSGLEAAYEEINRTVAPYLPLLRRG